MWALLAAVLLAGSAALELPEALRCRHERCRYIGRNNTVSDGDNLSYMDHYEVEGNTIAIDAIIMTSLTLTIYCNGASVLDSPALPRAEPAVELRVWELRNCPLPAVGSLGDALAALNLIFSHDPRHSTCHIKMFGVPATPALAAKHFTGLENASSLLISSNTRTCSERGFLAPLPRLYGLNLTNVMLPDGELDALPWTQMQFLELYYTGVEQVPAAVSSSLSLYALLIFSESALDGTSVPPRLVILNLQSPATTLRLDTAPALQTLSLAGWVEPEPPPLTECNNLLKMHLVSPTMRALPEYWLADCLLLEELVIEHARHLTTLPPDMFTNLFSLTRLAFKDGVLEIFPDNLYYQISLNSLELDSNRLRPNSSLLSLKFSKIQMLNLSSNDLDASANIVDETIPDSLTVLDLSHNPRIRDLCDESGYSSLRNQTNLEKLILRGTGVTRICRDWREEMASLQLLDLSGTNVTELSFEDLQLTRNVKAEVRLLGAPVGAVRVTRVDFKAAVRAPPSFTNILIDAPLQCDCRMYWARRALDPSLHALDGIRQLRCAGGGLLRDVPLEDMVCARPEECAAAELPPACACAVRPDDNSDHDRRLVRVRCEQASLIRVPRPRALNDSIKRLYELQLAGNQITDLHAIDLQDNIKGLDLRNNSLRRVDEETAKKLSNFSGMLWLAGNPLECDCSAAPLLRALHAHTADTDLKTTTCRDGSLLHAVPIVDCHATPVFTWLSSVIVVLLTIVVALMMFLSSRSRRFFALALLHRWGCVWRAAEPKEDESRRYDAFVTFSHVDSGVVRELMARLEPPYRLCVHDRDWVPGQYIAEQVVESVRESRRTLALVSRHFLASKWARAEFREAHTAAMLDARPRLLVVLLEEPAALPLDKELQRYISTQTYLRWGDPWFWDKIAVALPPPRPATPPPSRVSRQLDSTTTEPAIELSPVSHPATTDSGS